MSFPCRLPRTGLIARDFPSRLMAWPLKGRAGSGRNLPGRLTVQWADSLSGLDTLQEGEGTMRRVFLLGVALGVLALPALGAEPAELKTLMTERGNLLAG